MKNMKKQYFTMFTKRSQKLVGDILIENNIQYKGKPLTQEMWNNIAKKAEFITFNDNGQNLNWGNTYDKPIKLWAYNDVPLHTLKNTLLTGIY